MTLMESEEWIHTVENMTVTILEQIRCQPLDCHCSSRSEKEMQEKNGKRGLYTYF